MCRSFIMAGCDIFPASLFKVSLHLLCSMFTPLLFPSLCIPLFPFFPSSMGQRTSTQRIFGYFDQPDTTTPPQGTLQDRVLALPDYYGLLSTTNLAHDLAYIDATYYCNGHDANKASAKEEKKIRRHDTQKCDTDKLTFGDIEHLVQERKLRLHSRALVGLDSDILYLKNVTKLDL